MVKPYTCSHHVCVYIMTVLFVQTRVLPAATYWPPATTGPAVYTRHGSCAAITYKRVTSVYYCTLDAAWT